MHLRDDVHLKETGDRVHAVEDSKRKSDIDDGGPHRELVKMYLEGMIELGTSTKGRHDPQLWIQEE